MGNKHRLGSTPTIRHTLNIPFTDYESYKWLIHPPSGADFEIVDPEAVVDAETPYAIVSFKIDPALFTIAGKYSMHVQAVFDAGDTIWITDEPYIHEIYELHAE